MIAAAKNCGCPDESDFSTSPNFRNNLSSIFPVGLKEDSEKCVCPKPNEPGYEKLKGSCDFCCKGNVIIENKSIKEESNKNYSEIVEKGLPYKEIEAIINDNRMIIRVQKESIVQEEWDPNCDCIEENGKSISQKVQHVNKTNDITFRKVDLNQYQNPCRTVTVYPQADSEVFPPLTNNNLNEENENGPKLKKPKDAVHSLTEKQDQKINKNIDLEENPNIFLLRIKKRCENEDGKYNIDLEFRTPRPWLPKPVKKIPILPPTAVVENKDEEKIEKKEKKKKVKKGKKGKKGKK